MMTVKDLEKVQKTFQEAGQDYQVELESGKIIIVGPSDIVSSEIGIRLSAFLFVWVNPRRLSRVFRATPPRPKIRFPLIPNQLPTNGGKRESNSCKYRALNAERGDRETTRSSTKKAAIQGRFLLRRWRDKAKPLPYQRHQ